METKAYDVRHAHALDAQVWVVTVHDAGTDVTCSTVLAVQFEVWRQGRDEKDCSSCVGYRLNKYHDVPGERYPSLYWKPWEVYATRTDAEAAGAPIVAPKLRAKSWVKAIGAPQQDYAGNGSELGAYCYGHDAPFPLMNQLRREGWLMQRDIDEMRGMIDVVKLRQSPPSTRGPLSRVLHAIGILPVTDEQQASPRTE